LSKAFHKIGAWVKENWRSIVSIVFAAILFVVIGPGAFMGMFQGSMIGGWAGAATIGGLSGAFNAAINGGNLGDVLRGAAIGAIQGGISGSILHGLADGVGFDNAALHIAGHGVVGGAANEALGGKFQDGFLSAAAGAASTYAKFGNNNIYTRTLKASVVGGTASALGGGKFANGAWTAAFQHLLNDEMRESKKYEPGTVGANDDGGPDPAIESAFDFGVKNNYLTISENGILTVATSFQYVAWREGEFTGTSAKGSNGLLTWFHSNNSYSTYTIASGGRAMNPALRGVNSRIPKGVWQPNKHWETLPPFTGKSANAFMRNGVGFKFAIPTPGTNPYRSAILFHPTPDGRTSGCVGFCGSTTEMSDFRDKMLNLKGNYPKLIIE
jgi:hypothetical protein